MLWQDIRRSLPAYRTREGDDVYNAPYRATQVDLNAFVLEASVEDLSKLVDAQLNFVTDRKALIGSQRHLRFDCTEGWIVLIFASFRALSSVATDDRRQGSVSALELSVWVPVLKRQQVEGAAIDRPAWFLPLVYTSPTASVATGREVYGYPKVPAYLALADDGSPPVGVELRPSVTDLSAAHPAGLRKPPRKPKPHGVIRVENSPLLGQVGWDPALLDAPMMRTVVGRFYSNAPLVFRKQVGFRRDGDGLRAGYTALIESNVPITRLSNLELIEPSQREGVLDVLNKDVAAQLGIQNRNPLQGAAVRGCTLDIQQGSEIWVAAEPLEYIAPMPAPGNALMRGDSADDEAKAAAYDIEPNKPLSLVSVAARDQDDPHSYLKLGKATAELYVATPRKSAIGALLRRHFGDLGKASVPTPDPQRSFVVLQLLHAEVAGSETDVALFELGVHVPVLWRGEQA
jgi:hypothetical protein